MTKRTTKKADQLRTMREAQFNATGAAMTNVPATNGKVRTLEECEANIERHMKSFWEMGEEYAYIRDNKLYKKTHSNFDVYCRDRWGLEGDTVRVTIRATTVRRSLESPDHDRAFPLPTSVMSARIVGGLPEDEQADAWREAVEEAGGKIPPRRIVKDVVERRKAPPSPPPSDPEPSEVAHDAARSVRSSAEAFVRSVEKLMEHVDNLPPEDAEGAAYQIVQTVHAVLATLEDAGKLRPSVVSGLVRDLPGREVANVS